MPDSLPVKCFSLSRVAHEPKWRMSMTTAAGHELRDFGVNQIRLLAKQAVKLQAEYLEELDAIGAQLNDP